MKDDPPTARHETEVPPSRALMVGGATLSARAQAAFADEEKKLLFEHHLVGKRLEVFQQRAPPPCVCLTQEEMFKSNLRRSLSGPHVTMS